MGLRLHPLLTGTVRAPAAQMRREPGPGGFLRARGLAVPRAGWIEIPVPAFLVEHPSGPVLVDTGLGDTRTLAQAWGRLAATAYRDLRVHPLSDLLGTRGVEPGDVGLVVMTHLHVDHAAGLRLFPHATIVCARREWEAARRGRQVQGYLRSHLPDDATRVRLLDEEEVEVVPGIRMLPTPGHTAGHRSVVVELEGRPALLCADAAYTLDTLEGDVRPGICADRVAFEASLALLRTWRERNAEALVVPGHDMEAWSRLQGVYE